MGLIDFILLLIVAGIGFLTRRRWYAQQIPFPQRGDG
jgi:hypothetical protein